MITDGYDPKKVVEDVEEEEEEEGFKKEVEVKLATAKQD